MSPRPRHVLIIIENLTLPIDRRVMLEARSLLAAGYKVSCITPKFYNYRRWRENVEGVEVYRYPFYEATGGLIGYSLEFGMCLLATWLWSLWVFATRGRFDVIHACNPPDTFWLLGWFWRPFGTRFIFDEHDVCPAVYEAKFREEEGEHPNPKLKAALEWMERRSLHRADAVLNVCESYREDSAAKGARPREKLYVVRSAPDLNRFRRVDPMPLADIPNDLPHELQKKVPGELPDLIQHMAVYVGVMGPQDGLDYLVKAIGEYVNGLDRKDTLFVLIGDGPSRPQAIEIADELNILPYIKFPGYISGDDLLAMLSAASWGLLPDPKTPFNDKTAMNKVYEYLALGLTFVAFDLKENRYTAGEDSAKWVPAHDLEQFAREMAWMADNPNERNKLGETGRQHIEENHTWAHAEKELIAAYDYVLSQQ
jgi:glycosyltransferase involved in cell wall biosynthesis